MAFNECSVPRTGLARLNQEYVDPFMFVAIPRRHVMPSTLFGVPWSSRLNPCIVFPVPSPQQSEISLDSTCVKDGRSRSRVSTPALSSTSDHLAVE